MYRKIERVMLYERKCIYIYVYLRTYNIVSVSSLRFFSVAHDATTEAIKSVDELCTRIWEAENKTATRQPSVRV